jgi:DNA polymerase III subunit alpha
MNTQDFLNQFESFEIPINGVRLPTFKIDDKYKRELNLDVTTSNYEFLRALCKKGFLALNIPKDNPKYAEYAARVKTELSVMEELGFVDYILLVWDVINFCRENNIPTGAGRGSAAGSLVLNLIGVTKVDPIKYGLYFERFISKTRAKKKIIDGITYLDGSLMCDVDLDICYYNRSKVLAYLDEKYKGKTSKILTFNTLSAKLVIKEVGKIVGMKADEEMTRVTSMIPKVHGILQDLDETYNGIPDDKGGWKSAPIQEFVDWCDENPRVFQIAMKLKDLIKNKGVHPSGILISYDSLEDTCPTELSSDKDIVSSYDMNDVSLFTVKLDALGLRGVSVVNDVCKLLNIQESSINLDDLSIYRALQDLKHPHGLFQLEADLCFRTTQKVKPKNLLEVSAILAVARPGAMQFIDQLALYTTSGTKDTIHPFFEDILSETGGVCLYQEQMMQMAHKIGFTLDEAEILRRIVGKKKVEEVKAWEQKIKDKVAENRLDPAISGILWKILNDSASYSFNKSHSVAYGILAALTVYFKFNHPREFYLALLRMTQHEPDSIGEISKIHSEMKHVNLELLPPSLALSKIDFSIENQNIRFGLSSIKGIAGKTIEKLNNFERTHANKFQLFEAAKKAGLPIGVVSALIQAGTLDSFNRTRTHLVYEAQVWNKLTDNEKKLALDFGPKYDFRLTKIVKEMNTVLNTEKGKPLIKDSRMGTIKKRVEKYRLIYEQNSICEDFANWWYEKHLLGYVTCTTLRNIFLSKKSSLTEIAKIITYPEKRYCDFVGYIGEDPVLGTSKTASKSRYAKYIISDETGVLKTMIFNQSMEECKMLNGRMPKVGDIVIVNGSKRGEDTVFANSIAIQENLVYTKLSQLKDSTDDEVKESLNESDSNHTEASPKGN